MDRLTSATATGSPALSQSFSYDTVGNRVVSGVTYNAANQRSDLTYDLAGNVTADGASTSTYDALNRLTSRTASSVTTSYGVNGDGALVSEQMGSGTVTRYMQDLAAPLSQILSDGTTSYVYGADRLFRLSGSTRTWELHDGLGSVTRTSSDAGVGATPIAYEPFGAVQSGTPGLFGFTGERQSGSNVYLRARWYNATSGTFTARDPFAGYDDQPYSLHSYQYGYANPVSNTDPTGMCVGWIWQSATCQFQWRINTEDGLTYWGAVRDTGLSVVTAPAQTVAGLFTASGRSALVRGASYAVDHPGAILDVIGEGLTAPLTDLYAGFICDDSAALGRGLTGTYLTLAGGIRRDRGLSNKLRSADVDAAYWAKIGAREIESSQAPASRFSLLKQPNNDVCVGTCARMAGVEDAAASELEQLAVQHRGIGFEQLQSTLAKYGWRTQVPKPVSSLRSFPIMHQALLEGKAIIARVINVSRGNFEEHAVLIRSVDKVGDDWLITAHDPATGKIFQADGGSWASTTAGQGLKYAILER